MCSAGPLAKDQERRINRDPRQPSPDTGTAVKIVEVNMGSQERVLQRILGVLTIVRNSLRDAKNLLGMSSPNLFKGRRVRNCVPRTVRVDFTSCAIAAQRMLLVRCRLLFAIHGNLARRRDFHSLTSDAMRGCNRRANSIY